MTNKIKADIKTVSLISNSYSFLIDFNGTLADDEELLAELISEVSQRELGIQVSRDRYFTEFAGFTENHVFEVIIGEAGASSATPTELMHMLNALYLIRTQEVSAISAEAQAFVKTAKSLGKKVMVVTAASREVVVPALKQAGLFQYLEGIVALEDVCSSKPDPECYLKALTDLGIDSSHAVAFEDSRAGLSAAIGAGIRTVGVHGSLDPQALNELTPFTVSQLHPALLESPDLPFTEP